MCSNCHSPEYRDKDAGEPFSIRQYEALLEKYQGKVSCILFFNGEYDNVFIATLAGCARARGYKRALYTGFEQRDLLEAFTDCFEYLKTGVYREELGALDSRTTNQRMLRREADGSWTNITSEYWR